MNEEQKAHCWELFESWCAINGVSLESKEDYQPWWDCWVSAINAKMNED